METAFPTVVLSLLERDAGAVLRRYAGVPAQCGWIEIRADLLRPDDLPGLVARSPRPVLVAARRSDSQGGFEGSEEERRTLLEAALGSGAFVDVEWGTPVAAMAEGPHAGRIVLSHHGGPCTPQSLRAVYREMARSAAARLKIVPRARSLPECVSVRDLLAHAREEGRPLASFATGAAGTATRILAPFWGAWATYGSAGRHLATGDGQPAAADLIEVYDVLHIGPGTRLFGLVGHPVAGSPSPAMHAAGYRAAGIDARYLPLHAERIEEVAACVAPGGALPMEGFGVTVPLKEAAAARSSAGDPIAARARAVNTVRVGSGTWAGFNTDGPAALACIRRRLEPRGRRVAIAGAGGTGRAIAAALAGDGAQVTLYNRDPVRGVRAAAELGVAAAPWEGLAGATWDVLVQATPLGGEGQTVLDGESLRGLLVLDAVYAALPTPLVRAARTRGIDAIDGHELLVAQAVLQFEVLTGTAPDPAIFEGARRAWMDGATSP